MLTVEALSEQILQNMLCDLTQQTISRAMCSYQKDSVAITQLHKTRDLFNAGLEDSKNNKNNNNNNKGTVDYSSLATMSAFVPSTSQSMAGINNKTFNKDALAASSPTGNGLTNSASNGLDDASLHSASSTPAPVANGFNTTAINNLKDEVVYIACDNCNRSIATNRFAQHLERCLTSRTRK